MSNLDVYLKRHFFAQLNILFNSSVLVAHLLRFYLEEDSYQVSEVCWDETMRIIIGRLRFEIWENEGSLDASQFGEEKLFVDDLDATARHWVVYHKGCVVAAARLTWHTSLNDDYRDVKLWAKARIQLPLPTVDFGRLVVHADHRRRGLADLLNQVNQSSSR